MDETSDEPPTSAVLLDNCHFSQVIFNNVEKSYVPGGDITCYYTLTNNIAPRGKDWVGIFRVGWKTTREYYTFMWAPLSSGVSGPTAVQQQIQFKAYYLPKDDEYYQFCYVDQDGVVRGASIPFQFRVETEDDILVVTTQGEVEEIELQNKNLLKENEELKESCASLQKQNMDLQEQLKKTQELQISFESLKSNTKQVEQELSSLKEENKRLKELSNCRETEVHQLEKQIQKVTSEKEHLETRLKTALDHMDQLQSQVLNYEKEVARLDHDKTEQLESLKEENHQLCLTVAEQRKHKEKLERTLENLKGSEANLSHFLQNEQHQNRNLMKELEEKQHLFQALQAKNNETDKANQELRKENDDLLRRLSRNAVGGLVFGNPYCDSGANQDARAEDIDSIRKCPMCDDVFPGDIDTSDFEAHVQSHLLECPLCNETFEKTNLQVFDDHIYCHGLE
ncbi:calcium-binding and coiled-coil domain-containing protein 2 [Eudromia elegans]